MEKLYLDNSLFITSEKNDEDKSFICKNLYEHNVKKTDGFLKDPGIDIDLYIKQDDGNVIGGILCNTFCKCMYIDVLWIDDNYRKKGFEKELVIKAEKIAKENGCVFAHTCTFSYQSPGFYKTLGYEVFGIIDDYPDNIKQYFLKKKL